MTDEISHPLFEPQAAPLLEQSVVPDDPIATPLAEIPGLVHEARVAQATWKATPLHERVDVLRQVKVRSLRLAEALSEVIRTETGKPFEEALLAEALSVADLVDYWTLAIESLLEPLPIELDAMLFPGKRGVTERVARGVIALITPWNYPAAIPLRHLVPAVLCGNAVVLKPSEFTPRTGRMIVSLFAGLVPNGLVALVIGDGTAGKTLIESGVDAVSFTGGVASGRRVAASCGEQLIPCSLELGGKDAAIVLADANVERAANGVVWGAFTNAGQNCAGIERVYVEAAIAQRFVRRVVELTNALALRGDMGRMTTGSQAGVVQAHLNEAVAAGGQVLCGGAPETPGQDIPPTVVLLETEDVALMRDETFGPVLPIVVVANAEDAIARTNRCRYGLTASIWSKKVRKAEKLARRLEVGVVTINNHAFTAALPMAPWSGVKASGSGVTNSSFSLDGYTRPFFVLSDRKGSARELWWYPYGPTLRRLGLAMAKLRGGAGFFGRIAAFLALLILLPKRLLTRG